MAKRVLPKHIPGDLKAFRVRKRRQVRQALAWAGVLQVGCAYTPAYREISKAMALLQEAKQKMSVKNWRLDAK